MNNMTNIQEGKKECQKTFLAFFFFLVMLFFLKKALQELLAKCF